MTTNPPNLYQDDIRSVLGELAAIKDLLKEISGELLRIERRVRAAFPAFKTEATGRLRSKGGVHLNEQSAQQIIENLKERISKGEQIETQLKQYFVKQDLQTFAKILGMTNTKLPPKDELIRRIATRLRQSVSVAAGIHDNAGSNKR